jgi:plastocyanin
VPVPFARRALDRLRLTSLIVGIGLILAACGQATVPATPAASPIARTTTSASVAFDTTTFPSPVPSRSVTIQGFAFHPQAIVIPVGSTVTWTNQDLDDHTTTADDGTFNSDAIGSGTTFSFKFAKAGTYDYHCAIHPYMHGRIVVAAH